MCRSPYKTSIILDAREWAEMAGYADHAMLTSMIALMAFFIAATDHPYCGANAIEPVAYRIVLDDVTRYK